MREGFRTTTRLSSTTTTAGEGSSEKGSMASFIHASSEAREARPLLGRYS
jgi:hypothetical protein